MLIAVGHRRWVTLPVAAGLTLVMLLGAVAAGLRVPGLSHLGQLPGLGLLDYRTLAGSAFLPLRADYLDQLLGTAFGKESGIPVGSTSGSVPGGGAQGESRGPLPLVALPAAADAAAGVLNHELTNDDMDTPVVVSRLPFAARTDSTGATREAGEPDSCSRTGGTAWYRYTAARDGLLSADTFGSDHATALGVFRGTSPAALERVSCATGATGNAQTAFTATSGSTYFFQLTGIVGGGRLHFHLATPGSTEAVSASLLQRQPTHSARWAHVSGDGQVVVYETGGLAAPAKQAPCCGQIYALDRRTGRTTLVSRSSDGEPGNDYSLAARTSYDGRYVVFSSAATNLVLGDTNDSRDLFVHDRRTGKTTRASVGSSGQQGTGSPANSWGTGGTLSRDGRFVTFFSALGGLVEGDLPGSYDVFVRDLRTGVTTRENVDDAGNPGLGEAVDSRISADGRYVTFLTSATTLAPGRYTACEAVQQQVSDCYNLFLRDRWRNTIRLLSVDTHGNADMNVDRLDMSDDGRVIAWTTTTALEAQDTNSVSDVYVVDGLRGPPRRVSLSSDGEQQNDPGGPGAHTDRYDNAATARWVSVSGDGTRVAFDSRSTNLVPEDRNGASDVFLRDLRRGSTTRVSISSSGSEGDGDSHRPSVAFDGSVVVFESDATTLAPGDSDRLTDVFVHDLRGV